MLSALGVASIFLVLFTVLPAGFVGYVPAHLAQAPSFAGADNEMAIHGNNDPAALGHAVTQGSIRMPNAEITKLAALLPLGTPVYVTP